MNVQPVTVPLDQAKQALVHYRDSVRKRHNEEDRAILRGYQEIVKGNSVINLHDVFSQVECDHLSRPRLAICRADQRHVNCELWRTSADFYWLTDMRPRSCHPSRRIMVPIPDDNNRRNLVNHRIQRAIVPIIPPQYRPQKKGLHLFHILWEVDKWEAVPGDPMLLKHLGGAMYAVLAKWDLTPIERAVLSETRRL